MGKRPNFVGLEQTRTERDELKFEELTIVEKRAFSVFADRQLGLGAARFLSSDILQ